MATCLQILTAWTALHTNPQASPTHFAEIFGEMARIVSGMGIQQIPPARTRISTNFMRYAEAYRCLATATAPGGAMGGLGHNLHNLNEVRVFYENGSTTRGSLRGDWRDMVRYRSMQDPGSSDEMWADLNGLDHTLTLMTAALRVQDSPVIPQPPATPANITETPQRPIPHSPSLVLQSRPEPSRFDWTLIGKLGFFVLALGGAFVSGRYLHPLSSPRPPDPTPGSIPRIQKNAVMDFLKKRFPRGTPLPLYKELLDRLANSILKYCQENHIGPVDDRGSPTEEVMNTVIDSTFRHIHKGARANLQEMIVDFEEPQRQPKIIIDFQGTQRQPQINREGDVFRKAVSEFFSKLPAVPSYATSLPVTLPPLEQAGDNLVERLQTALLENKELKAKKKRRKLVEIFVVSSKEKYVGSVEDLSETYVTIRNKDGKDFTFEIEDVLTVRSRRPASNLTSGYIRVPHPQFPDKSINQSGKTGDDMMVLVDYSDPQLVSFLKKHFEPIRRDLVSNQCTEEEASKKVWEIIHTKVEYDELSLYINRENKLYSLSQFIKKGVCNERGMLEQIAYQYLGIRSQLEKGYPRYNRHAWVRVYPKDRSGNNKKVFIADPQADVWMDATSEEAKKYQDDRTPFAKKEIPTAVGTASSAESLQPDGFREHLKERWHSLNATHKSGVYLLAENIFDICQKRGIHQHKAGLPPDYLMTEILEALFKNLEDKGLTDLAVELRGSEEAYQRSMEEIAL